MSTQRFRFWGKQTPPKRTALLDMDPSGMCNGDTATMRLYAPIDSWGGEWGVSAPEFAAALDSLPDTVKNIDLHVNSPGGEVFEGVAILNMLRAHPADVTCTVDGIAASAASFIATGAGHTVMAPNSQMMIHDAWGVEVGNSADMHAMGDVLDKLSNNIANIYATGSGKGDTASWRATMQAESWYTADEAVAAGLADTVAGDTATDDDGDGDAQAAFDLSMFTYAGRAHAPAPGTAPAPSKADGVRFTDQATAVMADVTSLIDRASEVVALRAEKGKGIAPESADILRRLSDELQRLSDLTAAPDDTSVVVESLPGEYLAFLAKK